MIINNKFVLFIFQGVVVVCCGLCAIAIAIDATNTFSIFKNRFVCDSLLFVCLLYCEKQITTSNSQGMNSMLMFDSKSTPLFFFYSYFEFQSFVGYLFFLIHMWISIFISITIFLSTKKRNKKKNFRIFDFFSGRNL
jgi:hypothetical protein